MRRLPFEISHDEMALKFHEWQLMGLEVETDMKIGEDFFGLGQPSMIQAQNNICVVEDGEIVASYLKHANGWFREFPERDFDEFDFDKYTDEV